MTEGLGNWFARHGQIDEELVTGLKEFAFEMQVESQYRLPTFNAVRNPEGVDEAVVRKKLVERYDIEIGGGLGPLAGKVQRVAAMGHSARPVNIERLLAELREAL